MKFILSFLALVAVIGVSAAYLPPQYNPDQLYNENGLAYFMSGMPRNDITNMSVFDMTGFGYAYETIFAQLPKDGIGKNGFASGHLVSELRFLTQGLVIERLDNRTPPAAWYSGKAWADAFVPIPPSISG